MPGLSGLSVLARGGYATVYRAIQESVAREVAVKVENRTLDNERDQRRFLREARAAGRMSSHPHVVDLFDAGVTADQHPYLIMELCEGSYADRMRDAPLQPAEAREVGMKIADALADAHQLGVLHRDVKPANILRSRFGEPALADFGLAILAEARDSSVTLEVLTPAYAPPEMFRHSAPSPAVDVYALCATLYAVMRGKPPRWREDRNPSLITLMEMFNQPIPDLPGVPGALMDVLRHGMANEPESRPSAVQLREMLASVPLAGPTPPSTPRGVYVSTYAPPTPTPSPMPAAPASPGPAYPLSPGPGFTPGGPSGFASPPPPQHMRATSFVPPHDNTPTVGTGRRRSPMRGILAGVAALALLVVVSATSWYVASRPDPTPSPSVLLPTTGAPLPSLGEARFLAACCRSRAAAAPPSWSATARPTRAAQASARPASTAAVGTPGRRTRSATCRKAQSPATSPTSRRSSRCAPTARSCGLRCSSRPRAGSSRSWAPKATALSAAWPARAGTPCGARRWRSSGDLLMGRLWRPRAFGCCPGCRRSPAWAHWPVCWSSRS
ncbi:serine/threonine-protein kinase [Phytohabitans flavus]